jgi:hypothetical protein
MTFGYDADIEITRGIRRCSNAGYSYGNQHR